MAPNCIECFCVGCGLVHELRGDEATLEPLDDDPRDMVTNQCCTACGEALITADPMAPEPPEDAA